MPPVYDHFRRRSSQSSGNRSNHISTPRMTRYDENSSDEEEEYVPKRPQGLTRFPSTRTSGTQQSLTSFRFYDDRSPRSSQRNMPPPLELKKKPKKPSPSWQRRENAEVLFDNVTATDEEDLQVLVQRLLQGTMSSEDDEKTDLYRDCLKLGASNAAAGVSAGYLSASTRLPSRRRSSVIDNFTRRPSAVSMASDASAVPSLIFSDAEMSSRRLSDFSMAPPLAPSTERKKSMSSLMSARSSSSDVSWFMEDSPPTSPAIPKSTIPISFARGVELGMSLFDDRDDDDDEEEEVEEEGQEGVGQMVGQEERQEEEQYQDKAQEQKREQEEKQGSERDLELESESEYDLFSQNTVIEKPRIDKPRIEISDGEKIAEERGDDPSSPESFFFFMGNDTPESPQLSGPGGALAYLGIDPPRTDTSVPSEQLLSCPIPSKTRTRRRTASSECIVLEALEKMNAVMSEIARDNLNRASVVGLDLPGNQESVEAYGELWW